MLQRLLRRMVLHCLFGLSCAFAAYRVRHRKLLGQNRDLREEIRNIGESLNTQQWVRFVSKGKNMNGKTERPIRTGYLD